MGPVDDSVSPCASPTTGSCIMCRSTGDLLPMTGFGERTSICSDSSFSSLTSDTSTESLESRSSDIAPASDSSSASAQSPRSILKRKTHTTSRPKRSLTFHPSVLMWTAVQQGRFGELQAILEDLDISALREPEELGVNRANHQGITPLHLCCFSGATDCVELLLAHGAFPNQPDKDDWTPVHAAAISGHHRILRLLSKAGADLQHRDAFGRTPAEITENTVTKTVLKELVEAPQTKARCTAL